MCAIDISEIGLGSTSFSDQLVAKRLDLHVVNNISLFPLVSSNEATWSSPPKNSKMTKTLSNEAKLHLEKFAMDEEK